MTLILDDEEIQINKTFVHNLAKLARKTRSWIITEGLKLNKITQIGQEVLKNPLYSKNKQKNTENDKIVLLGIIDKNNLTVSW